MHVKFSSSLCWIFGFVNVSKLVKVSEVKEKVTLKEKSTRKHIVYVLLY